MATVGNCLANVYLANVPHAQHATCHIIDPKVASDAIRPIRPDEPGIRSCGGPSSGPAHRNIGAALASVITTVVSGLAILNPLAKTASIWS